MDENNQYLTTKEGLEKLKEELKERENHLRKKIANTLNEMRNQGDLSENDGYTMAVEEHHINEERITEIKEKIKNAKIVKETKKNKVGVGDIVTLEGKKSLKYQIVSEDEANPLDGKISHLSPIGESVVGKKIGDKVDITTPAGVDSYKIAEIN
jgi:transcription elongation factor GreA